MRCRMFRYVGGIMRCKIGGWGIKDIGCIFICQV